MTRFSTFLYLIILVAIGACNSEQVESSTQLTNENITPTKEEQEPLIEQTFQLKEGDLLFQDSDCGPFCDAIEKVTKGIDGANLSHIGMVISNQRNQLVILEAIGKGVVETPIDTFLNRSFDAQQKSKVLVGRIKDSHSHLVSPAIHFAKDKLGKPYDEIFDINNDMYYCSELIYLAFKDANKGQPIFQLRPMTFKDPDTKESFDLWVDYYKALKENIPEGAPGLNPGSISRSLYVEIIHAYGKPSGWRGSI